MSMREAGRVVANIETATRQGEFNMFARCLALGRGSLSMAADEAEQRHATPRVVTVLKSAIEAGGFGSGNWAEPLGDLGSMIAAFLDSLKNFGAFDAMLPFMKRVPLRTRLGLVSVGASAVRVPAAHVTPITSLVLGGNQQIDEVKALALMAMSVELARLSGSTGNDLFARELRRAVALVTDREFLALITAGVSPIASSGSTAIAVLTDLAAAFAAIDTDSASELFIVVEPSTAKAWSTKVTADGAFAFRNMSPKGGQMANVPVVVSDGLVAGTIVVADAYQIAGNAGGIELSASREADMEFEDAPDSPVEAATVLRSLWQHDLVGLKALRFFGAQPIGATAVAVIEGVSYSGNSPN